MGLRERFQQKEVAKQAIEESRKASENRKLGNDEISEITKAIWGFSKDTISAQQESDRQNLKDPTNEG